MFFQKPVKELMRNQIDCDILPCDAIIAGVEVEHGKLMSHNETFDCLIIPYSEALPMDALKSFVDLAKQDLLIYFIDGLPKCSSEGERIDDIVMFLDDRENVKVIGLDVLAQTMKAAGYYDIRVRGEAPHLRCYHSKQKEVDVYMFFNEHPIESIDTEVELPVHGTILFYDAYENIVWDAQQIEKESISLVSLKLVPFETIFIVVDNSSELQELELSSTVKQLQTSLTIEGSWSLSTATSMQYPTFTTRGELKSLLDLSRVEGLQSFSGTMRYKKEINWVHEDARIWIDLGDVFEIAEVFVNGESVGVRLQAPYQFEMSNYLREGINTIQVEVTNTLVKENNDMLSRIGHHEPSGLIGPVRILKEK
ncbi:glycosylhydrolase-like jelly roll fold domain-containing protein [Halalkalibacter sp. APA_J-10(15)]|uniref:glycosylhydrolase-like jelly roll fold domain-containing protein n=1 Tax=Halalkalibacter sp. APA_J-10(15) TaxID=2933805 RepID=UPI001FF4C91F|nr:glycosylhydrolase-like jelly roll fold domain-containing protein [Halalkalibacter sp. APA_J-10(15)]MCK0473381.1 hypothetical protein [Halalkalibacter sp. APA_J-10(15)]